MMVKYVVKMKQNNQSSYTKHGSSFTTTLLNFLTHRIGAQPDFGECFNRFIRTVYIPHPHALRDVQYRCA